MTTNRDIRFLEAAVSAALQGNRDGWENAVAGMDPQAAREFWVALETVQGCIEDTDSDADGRPWEA